MSGLVSGYSGIIAPPNLIANGHFAINQRNARNVTFPRKIGDYIADCWKVHTSTTVDNFSTYQWNITGGGEPSGRVVLSGSGKKGQVIEFRNVASLLHYGVGGYYTALQAPRTPLTACANFYNDSGVPVKVSVNPMFSETWASGDYTKDLILKSTQRGQAVKVITSIINRDPIVTAGFMLTLQEDGIFEVHVDGFGMFAGAFKNPPVYAPVAIADDLARCQRYYQKGIVNAIAKGTFRNAQYSSHGGVIPFRTDMAAAPTGVLIHDAAYILDGTGAGTYVNTANVIHTTGTTGMTYSVGIDHPTFGPNMANNGIDYTLQWTAEVV